MNFWRLLAILILLCVQPGDSFSQHATSPQTNVSPAQQTGAVTTNESSPQNRYDPLSGRAHFRGGLWDGVLSGINPKNRDIGQCLSEVRQAAVRATIENTVFWAAISMGMLLLLALLYLYWSIKDRARRLEVSVSLLTQIANAYLDAREHALDAIAKHNQLADDYNGLAEQLATRDMQRNDNQRRVRLETADTSTTPQKHVDSTPSDPRSTVTDSGVSEVSSQLSKDADAQAGRRFANQISALQEKNKTLRNSLNEVLAENENLKREVASMKGA